MAQPYIGEIRIFAGSFAPQGWMKCEGQLIAISEYDTLFTLLGTTYGGDGESTFALPDLRGRAPMHFASGYGLGTRAGQETVALTANQIPAHSHILHVVGGSGTQVSPHGYLLAESYSVTPYVNSGMSGDLNAQALASVGEGQPHSNMQPFTCLTYIISLFGLFPSP